MVLCMIFAHDFWTRWFSIHGIGRDGFRSMVLDAMVFQSMVLDASTCINMYCNIERNIMKNQTSSPILGSMGKSLCICVLRVMLSHCLFSLFKNSYAGNFCTGLKPTNIYTRICIQKYGTFAASKMNIFGISMSIMKYETYWYKNLIVAPLGDGFSR